MTASLCIPVSAKKHLRIQAGRQASRWPNTAVGSKLDALTLVPRRPAAPSGEAALCFSARFRGFSEFQKALRKLSWKMISAAFHKFRKLRKNGRRHSPVSDPDPEIRKEATGDSALGICCLLSKRNGLWVWVSFIPIVAR